MLDQTLKLPMIHLFMLFNSGYQITPGSKSVWPLHISAVKSGCQITPASKSVLGPGNDMPIQEDIPGAGLAPVPKPFRTADIFSQRSEMVPGPNSAGIKPWPGMFRGHSVVLVCSE